MGVHRVVRHQKVRRVGLPLSLWAAVLAAGMVVMGASAGNAAAPRNVLTLSYRVAGSQLPANSPG
jgi:hypothetical protein